jgi:hypothetical protein
MDALAGLGKMGSVAMTFRSPGADPCTPQLVVDLPGELLADHRVPARDARGGRR